MSWSHALLHLLFPVRPARPSCLSCQEELYGGEPLVCPPCRSRIAGNQPPLCRLCGREMRASGLCTDCVQRREPFFQRAVSYGPYQGVLRRLLLQMKKERVRALAPLLAEYLADAYAAQLADREIELLIPVPMAEQTFRERGFNQAAELATALGARVRLPVCAALTWAGPRRTQTGRAGAERRQRLDDAILLTETAGAAAGRTVCLIDDVYTTGTTANTCAMRLHEAGARAVYVLTVAR